MRWLDNKIKCEDMVLVKQNGDIYEISFRYDPDIINLVKQVPGRKWVPELKIWTIPKDRLGFLINQFKGTIYESSLSIQSNEDLGMNAELLTTKSIPDVDLNDVNFYVKEGCKPFQHQLDFMKYAIDRQLRGYRSGFLLADEMGLSKTCETINLAIYNKEKNNFKHCLVICCVNSSKYNWEQEIVDHTQGAYVPYLLGSRLRRNGSSHISGSKEKYEDLVCGHMYGKRSNELLPYFIIVNIEALRYKVGKKYVFADEIINWINNDRIQMIAIDEVHKNISPTSQQGKQLLRIKKNAKKQVMWIPMTGTPITNKPTDVFLPLRLIDSHQCNSYYNWCQDFCVYGGFGGYEIIGYKNIPKLQSILKDNMIRRCKDDVLDLPPKIYYTEYIDNSTYQDKLYEKVRQDILSQKEEISHSLNPMAKLLKLRQVNGSPELVDTSLVVDKNYLSKNAKLQRLLELLQDIHSRGEKVVIFSNWVEPLRTLYQFVSKTYKVCCYTGTMSTKDREHHKKVFIENPNYTVMIGTIGALGTSHTLTVARNVIFYDSPWTPADKIQAEDRLYRIGTKESVNVFTLVTRNTVDEKVERILQRKSGLSQYLVDGKLDIHNNPDLLDYLLS